VTALDSLFDSFLMLLVVGGNWYVVGLVTRDQRNEKFLSYQYKY
jgi:hypothetical protein